MTVRFLQTSDWQLGLTYHVLSPEAQCRYIDDQIAGIGRIGQIAAARGCQFVVVAGDVFEEMRPARGIFARACDALGSIPVPVFLLPGNHDPDSPSALWSAPTMAERLPPHVRVLRDTACLDIEGTDAQIVAAPWPSKAPDRDLLSEALRDLDPVGGSVVRIAVGHGQVDSLSPAPGASTISTDALQQALSGDLVSYVALGDRHSVTRVMDRVWYSGAPLVTDFVESAPNQVLVVDIDGGDVIADPVEVGQWQFLTKSFELYGSAAIEEVGDFLDDIAAKERTVVKLSLVGTLSISARARLEELLDDARHRLAGIVESKSRSDLAVVPDDADLSSLDLSGFARGALEEIAGTAQRDDPEGAVARDALLLLHRLVAKVS